MSAENVVVMVEYNDDNAVAGEVVLVGNIGVVTKYGIAELRNKNDARNY